MLRAIIVKHSFSKWNYFLINSELQSGVQDKPRGLELPTLKFEVLNPELHNPGQF
jgi:hypothetical protein